MAEEKDTDGFFEEAVDDLFEELDEMDLDPEDLLLADLFAENASYSGRTSRGRRLLRRFRNRPRQIKIDVYDGYGTSERIQVKGRLYYDRRFDLVDENDSRFRNLVNTSKRFLINEAEQVLVKVQLRDHSLEVRSDKHGEFKAVFENIGSIPYGVHSITVRLSENNPANLHADMGVGNFILHDVESDRIGIISDIDDTILMTETRSKVRLLKNVFLKNHFTQGAVEGMSDIYRSIHYGPEGDGYDATHYVSSSPRHLYSRINSFLDHRRFPSGSIDLKNVGLRRGGDSLFEHEKYKMKRIRSILDTYPRRRFVCFGDSGEHDPDIYRKISKLYPGQIIAMYIHNVTQADPFDPRYEGQILFTSIDKVRRDLKQRGLIYSA